MQKRGNSTTTWKFFCHFLPLPPFVYHPECGQKQIFFDPLLPSSYPHSYWMAPKQKRSGNLCHSNFFLTTTNIYCCAQIGINSFDSVFVESDAKSYAFESFCKVQPDWINLVVKKKSALSLGFESTLCPFG